MVETLDLPDVTYKKTVWNPSTTTNETDPTDITEDLSYTSTGNANGHPVMRKVDVADQDPNNTNIQEEVLKELDTDGKPVYELYATALARLEGASVGDATINDIMISLAANNYKIAEFTTYDRDGRTQIKNKHDVEIDRDVVAQAYMNMVEALGLDDLALNTLPNSDPANKENIQKVQVGMQADFFKKLQSITPDLTTDQQIALIKKYGVQAFGRANTMTYDERTNAIVVTIGQDSVDEAWH